MAALKYQPIYQGTIGMTPELAARQAKANEYSRKTRKFKRQIIIDLSGFEYYILAAVVLLLGTALFMQMFIL